MSTSHRRDHRGRLGLVAAALLMAGTGLTACGGDGDDPEVVGYFADASPLEVGNEVRASGVKVGKVSAIELEDGRARVSLEVDPAVYPLHEDASLNIRPINVLGENFVALDPGSPDAPELTGPIPLEQTASSVKLQDLLDTFDQPTAAALAALVGDLGSGLEGNGEQARDVIAALAPTFQQLTRVGDILREQNAALNHLVETADPVASAVAGESGARMERLIASTEQLLGALTASQSGLEETIDELPSTLQEARTTLTSLDTVAGSLGPALQDARPVTSDLEQISTEIQEFSTYATPAFNSFDELFSEADELLRRATPIAQDLRESGPGLAATARGLQPVARTVLDQHLGDLMQFVRNWALSTNGRDAVSHYFRGVFHVTPEALNALVGSDVVPEVLGPSGDGDGNNMPGDLPDLGDLGLGGLEESLEGVQDFLDGGGNLPLGVGQLFGSPGKDSSKDKKAKEDPDSATGLTSSQEQALLGQLLGGLS